MTLAPLAAAATALLLSSAALAQTQAYVLPPNPYETKDIAAPGAVPAGTKPTEMISFQSKLSSDTKDRLEGWLWKPAGASASAKVPLVLVAPGHTGGGTYSNPKTQFKTLAADLVAAGVGVMLVNSFSQSRHDYVIAKYNDPAFGILNGLNEDKSKRPVEASDHLVRPYDIVGAAEAVVNGAVAWADPAKMIAVGYSHGGTAVLGAGFSNHPVNLNNPSGGGRLLKRIFAAYPGCGMDSLKNYKDSAGVVPISLATGTADTTTPPGLPPGAGATGNCTGRYQAAETAAAANPSLYAIEWWAYVGATHSWEVTASTPNNAATGDWRTKIRAFAVGLKSQS